MRLSDRESHIYGDHKVRISVYADFQQLTLNTRLSTFLVLIKTTAGDIFQG